MFEKTAFQNEKRKKQNIVNWNTKPIMVTIHLSDLFSTRDQFQF